MHNVLQENRNASILIAVFDALLFNPDILTNQPDVSSAQQPNLNLNYALQNFRLSFANMKFIPFNQLAFFKFTK